MRRCAGVGFEQHRLAQRIFVPVRELLEQKRLLLKDGTIVGATIIEALPRPRTATLVRTIRLASPPPR
jgi:hypothetical protein